jgi:NAD(P)-dependent dehydrogenase (short-subunit alcohol dehydrogenase family)
MNNSLKHKTVFITGAAKRIGREIALELAEAGANIILHYNGSKKEALELKELIEKKVNIELYQCDFRDLKNVEIFSKTIFENHSIDLLINNASIFEKLYFKDTSLNDFEAHLSVNLLTPFILIQQFVKNCKKGVIINLLDAKVLNPSKDHFPYGISKDALTSLTYSLKKVLPSSFSIFGIALPKLFHDNDGSTKDETLLEPLDSAKDDLKRLKDLVIELSSSKKKAHETIFYLKK